MDTIWENYKEIVAIEPSGRITEHKIEFLVQEREEMKDLTRATQISHNVYLGNTADIYNTVCEYVTADDKVESKGFDVLIEAKDMVDIASPAVLRDAEVILNGGVPPREVSLSRLGWGPAPSLTRPLSLEFPSSTPLSTARHDPSAIVSFCEWMYHIAHTPGSTAESSTCEDVAMTDEITLDNSPILDRHILIHCADGYTESTFLALAYLIYAEGITAHEAWVKLHTDLGRSFFAFEADLKTLNCLQSYLLARSPTTTALHRLSSSPSVPAWFTNPNFDGSFPSRILDHMYLGNLQHANNPEMLRALGIKRVLSIGERVDWDVQKEQEAGMQIMYLDNVQDNGIDPLLDYIDPCLQFLGISLPFYCLTLSDEGKCAGESTLVHCRVGVSRSASICIAEVMRREEKTLPRAYLYVRARRLNVIIQPNLRFMYELMKWEEMEHARKLERMTLNPFSDGGGAEKREYKREMEWAWLCKEIADLNKTYTTSSS
jgi:dual specificity MAP kinase phosphatase